MCRVLLSLLFIILTTSSSVAQTANDFAPFKYMPEIPGALVLDGSLDFRPPLAFRRALQAHPETQLVVLQSDGGSVQAGLLIAEEIHERKLKTLIPESGRCASACSFVFFAGAVGKGKARTKVNVVCLYDKKTGRASIAEYKWLGS